MNDVVLDWVVTVVAFAVMLFLFGWQLYDRREWRHKCEREDMLRELHSDFSQQEQKMLSSFRDLHYRLDRQHRLLLYISRKLS